MPDSEIKIEKRDAQAVTYREVLVAAAWFGLVSGLVEAAGLLGMQKLGWLAWVLALEGVSPSILWISPVFNFLTFVGIAIVITVTARVFRRGTLLTAAVLVFAFVTFFDWIALVGRIRHSAMLLLAAGLACVAVRWFSRRQAPVLRFWRKSLPGLAALTLALALGIEVGGRAWERRVEHRLPAAAPGAPNAIVLLVDTLRSDHLSTYGYARPTSPNLTRIANQGVLFESAFATSSWTVPSHASLLTGRYPHEHGAETGLEPLDHRFPTLPEALQERGYRTGGFSANTLFFCRRLGLARGFLHFEDYFQSIADMVSRTLLGREFNRFVRPRLGLQDAPARRHAADINRNLLRWVDADRSRPFFAFLNYFDNHQPYLPPAPFNRRFLDRPSKGSGAANSLLQGDSAALMPEQAAIEVAAYDGATAYVDDQIGKLMSELHRRGQDQNTLLIITSDHGESLGEHGTFGHRKALYRDTIQVPLIFWWPGHLPAGARIATPISNVALPATVMDLLGDAQQRWFPGPSLSLLWKPGGKETTWPAPLAELAQLRMGSSKNPTYHGGMKSLVTSDWHYILHEKFGPSLYDWRDDPAERNDLSGQDQVLTREFRARLEALVPGTKGWTKTAQPTAAYSRTTVGRK